MMQECQMLTIFFTKEANKIRQDTGIWFMPWIPFLQKRPFLLIKNLVKEMSVSLA